MFAGKTSVKKILFLTNSLNRGGAERVFVNQVNYWHRRGVTVYLGLLFSTGADGFTEELLLPREQLYNLSARRGLDLGALWRLVSLIRQNKIEVVYSTLEWPNIMARLAKLFCPHLRVVIRESSAVVNVTGQVSVKTWKFKLVDVLLNSLTDTIIVLSTEMKQLVAAYQPFYAKKVKILDNGVIISLARAELDELLTNKITRTKFRILAVASMNYYERAFEYLIGAIALLPDSLKQKTELIFAGDGSLRPMYEKQVEELKLTKQIRFLGRIDTTVLRAEYRRADVFVLCSTAEGAPNVILEAMSFGLPVITTRVGSAVTMVEAEKTGFFIPLRDAQAITAKLVWFANHPVERIELGRRGYERASVHFSFENKMQELGKILEGDLIG